ncbi:molybdopterin molybdotransferase MoeA [Krasilnikovia sp. MM14-A1259]
MTTGTARAPRARRLRRSAPALTPWAQARALARRLPGATGTERIPLDAAAGRTLATAVVARTSLPGTDDAAVDGYAVRGIAPWRVVGRALAGHGGPPTVAAGEAVEIAAGAAIPAGTHRVVPYEEAQRDGDLVCTASVTACRHIRGTGEYVSAGEPVLPAGALLTPAAIGLAAAVGLDTVTVRRRPVVRLLVTGDEIVAAGTPPPGTVRDAVAPMLAPLLRGWGADVEPPRYVPDQPAIAGTAAIAAAVHDAEVTVVCGASSAGPADGLHRSLRLLGACVHVDGVACRPAERQVLAQFGDRWLVGVPGDPYAALVAALTLLEPLIGGLTGRPAAPSAQALLIGDVRADPRGTRLLPVVRQGACVLGHAAAQARHLGDAAQADALAVVPVSWRPDRPVELLSLT